MEVRDRLLLPHPVMAHIALPAGYPPLAELQIKPVVAIEQSAAADIAECQIDFVARAAADVSQRRPQRPRGVFHIHPEHQRRGVRQRRAEGRRMRSICRRKLLGARRSKPRDKPRDGNGEQQGRSVRQPTHDWTSLSLGALRGRPSRNGNTASMNACGWSMLTAWPAAGMTAFFAPGIFAAM